MSSLSSMPSAAVSSMAKRATSPSTAPCLSIMACCHGASVGPTFGATFQRSKMAAKARLNS
eukprot:11125728-Alexandrium_andersonii.AAC.1